MEEGYEAKFHALKRDVIGLRATQIYQQYQIQFVAKAAFLFAERTQALPRDGQTFESSLRSLVEGAVDRHLAAISDSDPDLADALRKVLEQQQLLQKPPESEPGA